MSDTYGDAFKKMLYRSDDGTVEEWIWNSRDGVTPFCVTSRCGKNITHVEWNRDQHLPDYNPAPGERYFVTLTEERARQYAEERVEANWPMMAERGGTKAEWIDMLTAGMRPGESPDLATAGEAANGVSAPLPSTSAPKKGTP